MFVDFTFESDKIITVGSACDLHDGKPGICTPSSSCQWLLDGFKNGLLSYGEVERCGFMGQTDVVCCKQDKWVNFSIEMFIFPVND